MSHECNDQEERDPTLYAEGDIDDDEYEELSITPEEQCEEQSEEETSARSYSLKLDFKVDGDTPTLEIEGKITGKFDDESHPVLAAIAETRNK